MNIVKWALGILVFLFISLVILGYSEYSVSIILFIAASTLVISLFIDKKKTKKNY